jgi:uncharacterized protein (DUF58 family)
MRRLLLLTLLAILGVTVFAAAGDAYTVSRTQNPQFRVTVTIRPGHPEIGDRIVATVKIVNRTDSKLRGEYEVTWETPTSGIGAAQVAVLEPGVIIFSKYRARVRASTPAGRYRIFGAVQDRHGRTHAAAHVTSTSG